MKFIFLPLYELHPALPLLWFALFANGLLAPGIYCVLAKIPYDIGKVWQLARGGSAGAKYAIGSWVTLLTATLAVFALAAF